MLVQPCHFKALVVILSSQVCHYDLVMMTMLAWPTHYFPNPSQYISDSLISSLSRWPYHLKLTTSSIKRWPCQIEALHRSLSHLTLKLKSPIQPLTQYCTFNYSSITYFIKFIIDLSVGVSFDRHFYAVLRSSQNIFLFADLRYPQTHLSNQLWNSCIHTTRLQY